MNLPSMCVLILTQVVYVPVKNWQYLGKLHQAGWYNYIVQDSYIGGAWLEICPGWRLYEGFCDSFKTNMLLELQVF
jgi:hypothetical protein